LPFGSESSVFPSAIHELKGKIHKNIILSLVLYGYEKMISRVKERMFENRVRRILGSVRDEIMGNWRNLCKERRHDLYF
jgi:hypothetical protein